MLKNFTVTHICGNENTGVLYYRQWYPLFGKFEIPAQTLTEVYRSEWIIHSSYLKPPIRGRNQPIKGQTGISLLVLP